MAYRRWAVAFSVVTTLASIVSIAVQGFNLGLDFTGGTIIEVAYAKAADLPDIRAVLAADGFANAEVQNIGGASEVLIRLPPTDGPQSGSDVSDRIARSLRDHDASATVRRSETVGPQVGEELVEQGGLAMFFALLGIFVYVMVRFRWKFALGAIVATMHDAIVTVGIFSLFRWEFDLTVLGAVLAVIGYSVNDTIVVYDRIRDNFRSIRRASSETIVDRSINQTLSRTIVTGLTTLLVLFALLIFGGPTLWGFSMALILGIVVGTYSSVYVASAMAVGLKVRTDDFIVKPAAEIDSLP